VCLSRNDVTWFKNSHWLFYSPSHPSSFLTCVYASIILTIIIWARVNLFRLCLFITSFHQPVFQRVKIWIALLPKIAVMFQERSPLEKGKLRCWSWETSVLECSAAPELWIPAIEDNVLERALLRWIEIWATFWNPPIEKEKAGNAFWNWWKFEGVLNWSNFWGLVQLSTIFWNPRSWSDYGLLKWRRCKVSNDVLIVFLRLKKVLEHVCGKLCSSHSNNVNPFFPGGWNAK
jgi:hypothetical protein